MFSYRHAFHAGNHADVLKHLVLIAILRHLTGQGRALVGGRHARRGRAVPPGRRLCRHLRRGPGRHPEAGRRSGHSQHDRRPAAGPSVADYLRPGAPASTGRATGGSTPARPSSPRRCCAPRCATSSSCSSCTRPTARRWPATWPSWAPAGRSRSRGRTASRRSRRCCRRPRAAALVLIDPSYEIKSDYGKVLACAAGQPEALCHRHLHASGTRSSRGRKRTNCRAG